MTLKEWQEAKMVRVQKSVLLIRSSFEHCVEAELRKQGFNKATIVRYTVLALFVVITVLSVVYCTMRAANAFGAVSAMVSSGMSAVAIGIIARCRPLLIR